MGKQQKKSSAKSLWQKEGEDGVSFGDFVEQTANTHKMIFYGETGTGKTRGYLKILEYLKKQDIPPEEVQMEILLPDRATGVTKLAGVVPEDYRDCINVHMVADYEMLVKATSKANENLKGHYKEHGCHGWLVVELLGELWTYAQDYYTRQAYGETLADYFAEKKQVTSAIKEDKSAYRALEGWKDWTVIKFFHNYNWIDKIKKMPFNLVFTAEVKSEGRKDSIFYEVGRPDGEKDNMHRVDEILKFKKDEGGNKYYIKPFKLTGYTAVYPEQDVTNDNTFGAHIKRLKRLEENGYRESLAPTSESEDTEKSVEEKEGHDEKGEGKAEDTEKDTPEKSEEQETEEEEPEPEEEDESEEEEEESEGEDWLDDF